VSWRAFRASARRRRFGDRRWLDRVRADIAAAGRQKNWTRNRVHIAELIAAHADRWLRSRPTMAILCQLSGLSLRTVQDCCRWLENGGWLAVLEHGTTPQYAPDRLNPGDDSLAREWLLITPAPGGTCTPTHTPAACKPTAGAHDEPPLSGNKPSNEDRRCAPGSESPAPPPWRAQEAQWPAGEKPQRRGERLTACRELQRRHMVLRWLSARRLRSILRPWLGSPWEPDSRRYTPADVLHALDFRPGAGGQHEYAGPVTDPAGWLAYRLSFWLDADGRKIPPHSAVLAGHATQHRAARARDQDARNRTADARAGDYTAAAAAARTALYAALGRPLPARQPATA